MFFNGKEIFKFKAGNKDINFPTQFCLGSMSNRFSATDPSGASLIDFSIDYNSIDTSDLLNTHKYLMTKNNIKQC